MTIKRFEGRSVIVTGAAGAIGRAIAKRFAAEGAAVCVSDLKAEGAEAVAEEIRLMDGNAFGCGVDVTQTADVAAMAERVLAECGKIDILVNNAGGSAGLFGRLSRFRDAGEEVWSRVLDLNLHGTLRCIRAVLNPMIERRYGRIVSIASIAAAVGILDRVDYSAAKGGIVSLTKALAMEVGGYGVTVNSVSPGAIARRPTDSIPGGTYAGRMGTPEEVASLVAFLASEEAAFITGCDYIIDGGRVLGPARSMETTQHN